MNRPPRLGSESVRIELGLMAFAPAMALMALRARHDPVWLCFGVPALLGCVVAVAAAVLVSRGNPEPFTFDTIDDVGDEVIGHIGSFLLPVVVDVDQSNEQVLIAGLALALIVQIHIVTGRVHVNPLLYLFGYRVYRATSDTGVVYHLLARTDVSTWSNVRKCVPVGASLLIERRRDTRQQE